MTDNGCGIPANELELAVSRHATSKLTRTDELFDIKTLGFRGEALASIGSVAHLTLVSKMEGDRTGAKLVVDGGEVSAVSAVAAPTGTEISVEDLFYNVPARFKFLKKISRIPAHYRAGNALRHGLCGYSLDIDPKQSDRISNHRKREPI